MPIRLQELIHKFEEGAGYRYLKYLLAVFVMIAAAVAYDLAALRNLSTAEGMDAAQLAWNIADGRGFRTYFIRPLSIYLLKKKHSESQSESGPLSLERTNSIPAKASGGTQEADVAYLNGSHPDLANAPFYPLLLAGLFKVTQVSHPDLGLQQSFKYYYPDLCIGILNQTLFLSLLVLTFFLARRLFDEPVAWAASVALLGSELLWRFSLSGLPTLLLMNIFVALTGALARLEGGVRDERRSSRSLVGVAAWAGALVGLGGMTRYGFAWLIVPVLLWVTSIAGPKRGTLALGTLAAFLVVMGPWLLRNYNLSGAPFGTAGYALFENTPSFVDEPLERTLNPDFSGVTSSDFWQKLVTNTREIVQNDLPKLGGSWMTAFFLAGLVMPFRNPTLNRLRWFLLVCLGLLIGVQALGRTAPPGDSVPPLSDNLLIVLAPIVFIYGASFFFILFEQTAGPLPSIRFVILAVFSLLACAPLVLTFFAPYPSPLVYPPYYPPWIQEKAWSVDEKSLIMSDIPWAVAWYGQRQSVALPLKYKSKPGERFKNDFYSVDALKPVNALYLTAKTLKNLEPRALRDWLKNDPDAALLNRLRQRVVENQGREEKTDEDMRLFAAVRERLVANAEPAEEKAEDWEHFVLTTFLKSEVPTGFPLRRAPEGLFPELFLTETERGTRKAIQSSQ